MDMSTILNRVAELADKPIADLRSMVTAIEYYGDNPPTRTEIKLCTTGETRGSLIRTILLHEYDV